MDFLRITNIVRLDDELYIVEIFNNDEDVYAYYLYKKTYTLANTFEVMSKDRFSDERLRDMYNNGYFDSIIEDKYF